MTRTKDWTTNRPTVRLPVVAPLRLEWQDHAACRGEDATFFFGPDKERPRDRARREAVAKNICAACPVRAACLRHAMSVPEMYGVWGGLSEDERRLAASRRRLAVA
jgi:WhiB family transcriptional regulator, redox-sensing transcriptional regulator